MMRYLVVFTNEPEEEAEASVHLAEPFWTIRMSAKNAKEARHKAWKTVNKDRRPRFIKQGGWRICHVGRPEDIKAAGPWRAPGISIT